MAIKLYFSEFRIVNIRHGRLLVSAKRIFNLQRLFEIVKIDPGLLTVLPKMICVTPLSVWCSRTYLPPLYVRSDHAGH